MYGQLEVASRLAQSSRPQPPVTDVRYGVRQRYLVLAAFAAIAIVDQSVKWWGWRHASGVRVNYGGDLLVPAAINSLYSAPVTGALLDLLGAALLISAASLLLRRRRSTTVIIAGTLIIGGWGSNLLDRLFMHYWTAPGSVRGVVDFLPIGRHYYNLADMFIITGTPLFILAVAGSRRRSAGRNRPVGTAELTTRTPRPRRVRTAILLLASLLVLIGIICVDVVKFGGLTAPLTSTSSQYQLTLITHDGAAYEIP
jgi:lipoprotein signal peptidase